MNIKKKRIVLLLTVIFCMAFTTVAFAAPGYIIGGYRYLSSEVATSSSLMQEVNQQISHHGLAALIVDLHGIPFYYAGFMAAGGINYPGGFQAYALKYPAIIPTGTMIKHADGTLEPDPEAVPPLVINPVAVYDGMMMTKLTAKIDDSVTKIEVIKGGIVLSSYIDEDLEAPFDHSFMGAIKGEVLTINATVEDGTVYKYQVIVTDVDPGGDEEFKVIDIN